MAKGTVMRTRVVSVLAAAGVGVAALLAPTGGAAGPPLSLGATVRVTTPGTTLCPAEGEPETAVTASGTWVAYNDDHQCPLVPGLTRVEEVQLIPPQGPVRFIPLNAPANEVISGDPDLAPASDGGVYLAALWQDSSGALGLRVLHISPRLVVTALPTPSLHGKNNSDDKEFIATDLMPGSRYRGHLYIVWDDFQSGNTTFRAWTGREWAPAVTIASDNQAGTPDVAVGPHGFVAVAFDGDEGATVRISHDGGRTFGPRILALPGADPGRTDPNCPLRPTVGVRQRALMGPRVAFDRAGDLHVVAAMGDFRTTVPPPTDTPIGTSTVEHAVVRGTSVVHREKINGADTDEQWAAALAPLPRGGIAVSWLQTNGPGFTTYDAWIAVEARGARTFSAPQRLSTASSQFPAATEAVGNSNCYGLGDYIGMATTSRGVETVWPTTTGDEPGVDSDVLVRWATATG